MNSLIWWKQWENHQEVLRLHPMFISPSTSIFFSVKYSSTSNSTLSFVAIGLIVQKLSPMFQNSKKHSHYFDKNELIKNLKSKNLYSFSRSFHQEVLNSLTKNQSLDTFSSGKISYSFNEGVSLLQEINLKKEGGLQNQK